MRHLPFWFHVAPSIPQRWSVSAGLPVALLLTFFTFAVPFATADYFEEVMIDNPLGYWRLGEQEGPSAFDSSGHGIDGTYTEGVTLGIPSIIPGGNTAALMDGQSGRAVLGQPTSINTLAENFTIEAWIRPNRITGPTQIIVGNRTYQNALGGGFGFAINESGLLAFVAYGPRGYNHPDTHISPNAWQHVAVVFDAERDVHFYINGSLAGAVEGDTTVAPAFEDLVIGRNPVDPFGTGIGQFDGIIDEVAIYGSALSADDLERHYLAGVPEPRTYLLLALGGALLIAAEKEHRSRSRGVDVC